MTSEIKKVDLIIENGTIVTLDSEMRVIKNGWLAIDKGKIIDMGVEDKEICPNCCDEHANSCSDQSKKNSYKAMMTVDATNKLIMPGFINTHTHIPMSYLKGVADDLPLHEWLNNYIWPIEGKMVRPEYVYHSAIHGIAELIKNGVVMFNDQYFEGLETAKAAKEIGIRAVIGEGIIDFPVANYHNSQQIIDYTMRMFEQFKEDKLIEVAMSPHAIYTCSKETLKKCIDLAKKNNMLLHTHLAETEKEFNDSMKDYGMTPTEYLDNLGFWEGDCVAAHSVWLTDNDINILAKRNVSIAINCESNLKLASGFIPINRCMARGVNLTTATDGVASNNNLSIIEEMSTTAKVHKALNNDPTFLPAFEIIKFPTNYAAKALRKEFNGSIELGNNADVILINLDKIESLPMYDVYSQIVYNLSSADISDVIIDGKIVMLNRILLTVDEDEIKDRARFYQNKLMGIIK